MDPELEAVEWHDAQLERVVREGGEVRLEFSSLSVYRKLGPELYQQELGAAVLSLRSARVVLDPPGDERTSRDSRWVMDCTRSEPVAWHDIQSFGRGTGPGEIEFEMADCSSLAAEFQSAQLTLVGPLRKERIYEGPLRSSVRLSPTRAEESEELVSLRIRAMQESLERIGRFDAQRARERFLAGFVPEFTRHILADDARVGFVVVKPTADGLSLEHLYVRPEHQRRGIGSAVLAILFAEADSRALPLRVGALRGSDANHFYQRHGFIHVEESEWDIYYVRPASIAKDGNPFDPD